MSNYNQQQLISQLHQQVEIFLEQAISNWQLIPHSKFAMKQDVDAWCANECLQHLNSYGRYYLPAIEEALKKASSNSSSNNFSSGWLGNYFTKLMLPNSNGLASKKMKSPKDYIPTQILESYLVISEFIDQQEKLLALLNQARKVNLNKSKVGISIAPFIKLKMGDVFMFLVAHLTRHANQAERALENAGLQRSKMAMLSFSKVV